MNGVMRGYIHVVDQFNYRIGRFVMYGLFALFAVLLWSSISKAFFLPSLWTLEIAQFLMVAYYMVGGPYAMQMGANVRMDLFYGEWTKRQRSRVDIVTIFFLIFYLCVLLYGGVESTIYAFEYNERSPTAWRPYLWPIKVVMCFGIFMMLLQAVSQLFKDILRVRGDEF